jgi:hypothetical protein
MKAKDYAALLDTSSVAAFDKSTFEIIDQFCKETSELIIKIGSQSIEAGVGVLNEQDKKWIALCHILEAKYGKVLKKTGFRELIRMITPFFLTFWTPAPIKED